jgi:hypothetical protein
MGDFEEEKAIEWLRAKRVVIPLWSEKLTLDRSIQTVLTGADG